jgi:hypothetical protein
LAIGALDRFAVGAFAVGWFVVAAPGLAGDDVAGLVELPAGFAGAAAGLAGAAGFFVVLWPLTRIAQEQRHIRTAATRRREILRSRS